MYSYLNPEKALIFRIEHIDNLVWNLEEDALHCRNSGRVNPNFVSIGNPDLINARATRSVPIDPGGTLSDYVPFYFTPFSMMLFNIHTGRSVQKRGNQDIIIFVSSLHRLSELELRFVFTDQHAYVADTNFYSDPNQLNKIDWTILQNRDFKRNDADPGKGQRYQAEALVYQCVPFSAILGVCCFNDATKGRVEALIAEATCRVPVHSQPGMYF